MPGFLVVSKSKASKIRRVPLDREMLAVIRTHVGRLAVVRRILAHLERCGVEARAGPWAAAAAAPR